MGFLFDDDAIPELGSDGPREAADAWNDLLGLVPGEPSAATPDGDDDALETDGDAGGDDELEVDPEPTADDAPAELWLEELAPVAARAAAPAPRCRFRRRSRWSCSRSSGARRPQATRRGATAGRSACSATSEQALLGGT